MKLIVTGASGNIGRAIIASNIVKKENIYACVRKPKNQSESSIFKGVQLLEFDFEKTDEFDIPNDASAIFLMRPPHISNPSVFDELLLKVFKEKLLVIFLSIQGAENKEYTPHRKIERKIIEAGLNYVFIRPSYFMDNLTTTLLPELIERNRVFLPSGRLKFNWVAATDVGAVISTVFLNQEKYKNKSLELAGLETIDFYEVINIINAELCSNFTFSNPNILSYLLYVTKKRMPLTYVLVMLLLHWLPKFGKPTVVRNDFVEIMSRQPIKLNDYVRKNRDAFLNSSDKSL